MSSNLPPGVSESMIPGNRPEDEAEERFWDELWNRLYNKKNILPPDIAAMFVKYFGDDEHWTTDLINIVREMAYTEGMNDGRSDEQAAQMYGEEEMYCPDCHTNHGPDPIDCAMKRMD